jgi:hypothetical protein
MGSTKSGQGTLSWGSIDSGDKVLRVVSGVVGGEAVRAGESLGDLVRW